jgi:ATP-dependent helicase HrpB
VVTAEPGAGKTTRVPPALAAEGPVILLQPRRVAVRAIAARIADERGWTLGREVGWQVRFERRFSADTRLLVVTEGILTARLQADPLLSNIQTIILDEFHERSIHADLALALARQAWLARDDLRIVVMSATLDTAPVAAFLGDCPVVSVPGRLHPIDVSYAPEQTMAEAVQRALVATTGDVLCFLPGAPEIRRATDDVTGRVGDRAIDVLPLHGSLDADAQDRAVQQSARRKIVLATNIAETSLTVPGVTAVIDSGLHKVARYDPERGIDSLELERITADAAEQRAGRAGRVAPGVVVRLWDRADRLKPHREPEIHRVDLAATALEILAWGADPRAFEWFESPNEDALGGAMALLDRLGLVSGGRLTAIGEQVRRLPLAPRLARILVAARGATEAIRACAVIAERHFLPPRTAATTSDLLAAIDDWPRMPPHVHRLAREIERLIASGPDVASGSDVASGFSRISPVESESAFRRAILAGYPDRVAARRAPLSPSLRLASGTGAVLGPESGVHDGEFLVAVDVQASSRPGDPNARVRIASIVDRDWLVANRTATEHVFDQETGTIKAALVEYYDALVLRERPAMVDADVAAGLLAEEWHRRGPRESDLQLVRRMRFAGHEQDLATLVVDASRMVKSVHDVVLARAVPPHVMRALDVQAPETLVVPSGRSVRLDYGGDGSVGAAVKLQELFGLGETPRVGAKQEPVVLSLLAPNGRPVQITRDLRSFWDRTYPDVRKELRGRYPRHPWPDDPWNARPTARTRPKPPRQ